MAEHVVKQISLWANELNLSTYATSAALQMAVDAPESTAMDDDTKTFVAGLKTNTVSYNGWTDVVSGTLLNAMVGASTNTLLSYGVEPQAAVGTVGYLTRGVMTSYDEGAQIGAIASYTIAVQGTGFAGRGLVGANGTHTATANQTGSQQGALSATQTMYSALHVELVSGTGTLDVTIESDDNGGFATPTTRITHAQLTASGSELASVAGAITDDYWRAVLTITGTVSFKVFVVLAIV